MRQLATQKSLADDSRTDQGRLADQWSAAADLAHIADPPDGRVALTWRTHMQQDQQSGTKMHAGFAKTPEPPYHAVIFTSQRTEGDRGYEVMAHAMFELALKQPGCLGAESVCDVGGFGITVAYFTDESAIHAWKQNSEHLVAQRLGKQRWH